MKKIPVAKEAKRLLLLPLAIFVVSLFFGLRILCLLSLVFFAFLLYFFRDPERNTDIGEDFLTSPADGRVLRIEPASFENFGLEKCSLVSIFMSPFDVHINRSPAHAQILELRYLKGAFKGAFKKGVERLNERNYILMQAKGKKILVIQIAGFLARRIYCYLKEGMEVKRGERIGMIAFGSRVDVCLPEDYDIMVKEGEKVKAGITPIAKMRGRL